MCSQLSLSLSLGWQVSSDSSSQFSVSEFPAPPTYCRRNDEDPISLYLEFLYYGAYNKRNETPFQSITSIKCLCFNVSFILKGLHFNFSLLQMC